MHSLNFFLYLLEVYYIQGILLSNDIGRTMLGTLSPLTFYHGCDGIVEKVTLYFSDSFQYLMQNEEYGLLKFYNYIQGLCWKNCKWTHNAFCRLKRQARWKDLYSLLREIPVENIRAMIFTPDILHLGMEFWKTLLQVCICVISDSCFSSIKRFLLNFINLFFVFWSLSSKLLFHMDSRSPYKMKTFMTDASSFRKKWASSCHQARYSCVFFRSFPSSITIREKQETSLILNEYCSSSNPLVLVFCNFFLHFSWEISSSFMTLIVDIVRPMKNLNSAS